MHPHDADLLELLERRADSLKGRPFDPHGDILRLRALLAAPRSATTPSLLTAAWRQAMSQPLDVDVWGGARALELARLRFGHAANLRLVARPEDALANARKPGAAGVAVLTPDTAWWGRLLAEPRVRIFAVLPELAAFGPMTALAFADTPVEPTGEDRTFWVTDARQSAAAIEASLSHDGVAATLLVESNGLKLFLLAGFYQPDDPRLARAPGGLAGVIGAAPAPLDV